MNFKKIQNKFWARKASGEAGFTLVELIVVIAILGILAGVGVVGYNGYIKKANIAADQQLLDAVNTAFAAACLSNGESHIGRTDVDGKIVDGAFVYSEPFADAFNSFYEGGEFKVFIDVSYDELTGQFVEGTIITVTFGGQTYQIKQSSVDNFKAATVFSENIEAMQTQVNSLAAAFNGVVGDNLNDLAEFFGDEYAQYLADNNISGEQAGNATVLYVAQQAAGMTSEEVAGTFYAAAQYMANNPNANVVDVLMNSTDDPLTGAALMYGAITAYANQPGNEELKTQAESVNNAVSLLGLFQTVSADREFAKYVGDANSDGSVDTTTQFNTDMNGFLGALDVINTVSPNVNVGTENVWTSDEVNSLLTDILG